MLSTLQVDDQGDALDALAATALVGWHRNARRESDARHDAIAAMPSSLCSTWAPAQLSLRTSPATRARPSRDPWMLGSVLSTGLAVLMLFAAMVWRLEHPRVIHVEGAPVAPQAADYPAVAVDVVTAASP